MHNDQSKKVRIMPIKLTYFLILQKVLDKAGHFDAPTLSSEMRKVAISGSDK